MSENKSKSSISSQMDKVEKTKEAKSEEIEIESKEEKEEVVTISKSKLDDLEEKLELLTKAIQPNFSEVKRKRKGPRVSRRALQKGPLSKKKGFGDSRMFYYFPTEDELPMLLEMGYRITDMTLEKNQDLQRGIGTGKISEGTQSVGNRLTRTYHGCQERHVLVECPKEDHDLAKQELKEMRRELAQNTEASVNKANKQLKAGHSFDYEEDQAYLDKFK